MDLKQNILIYLSVIFCNPSPLPILAVVYFLNFIFSTIMATKTDIGTFLYKLIHCYFIYLEHYLSLLMYRYWNLVHETHDEWIHMLKYQLQWILASQRQKTAPLSNNIPLITSSHMWEHIITLTVKRKLYVPTLTLAWAAVLHFDSQPVCTYTVPYSNRSAHTYPYIKVISLSI